MKSKKIIAISSIIVVLCIIIGIIITAKTIPKSLSLHTISGESIIVKFGSLDNNTCYSTQVGFNIRNKEDESIADGIFMPISYYSDYINSVSNFGYEMNEKIVGNRTYLVCKDDEDFWYYIGIISQKDFLFISGQNKGSIERILSDISFEYPITV